MSCPTRAQVQLCGFAGKIELLEPNDAVLLVVVCCLLSFVWHLLFLFVACEKSLVCYCCLLLVIVSCLLLVVCCLMLVDMFVILSLQGTGQTAS